jgi:hypothetical protein
MSKRPKTKAVPVAAKPSNGKRARVLCLMISTVAILAGGTAQAIMVDLLQPNSSGSVNTFYGTAIFNTDTTQPTGTGVFDPFLTVQNNGVEQGYNSSNSNAPFDVKRIPQWNHEITVSEMKQKASVTIGNAVYYRFLIDVNEPNTADKALISLDSLKLFTSPIVGQTTTNVEALGVKRFDLDIDPAGMAADNWALYDDRNHGSGESDIAVLIPSSAFATASDSDYVYMYQKWGEHQSADLMLVNGTEGGFEETKLGGSFSISVAPVPEPTTVLFGIGLVACTGLSRRRTR